VPKSLELTTGELFAGAGGLGLGVVLAGHPNVQFRPVFAIDNEPHSVKTHSTNMRWLAEHAPDILPQAPAAFKRDAETLNVSALLRLAKLEVGELGILLGGPPCQGFSASNRKHKEQSKAERNRLVKVFFDRLSDLRPKMFLFENVQGVRWTKPTEDMQLMAAQDPIFQDIQPAPSSVQEFAIQRAMNLGYRVWFGVLDAVNFGVPQTRARFFLFGVHEDFLNADDSVALSDLIASRQRSQVTVEQAIGDLPKLGNGDRWKKGEYRPGESQFVTLMRQFMTSNDLYDHFTSRHADYVIERYKKIPSGSNWESIRDEMSNYSDVDNTHSNIDSEIFRATEPQEWLDFDESDCLASST
jgi:DNA (cytosine-5)-methyltransferase 1